MKEYKEECDEFYIGYIPDAPPRTGKIISYSILVLGIIVVGIALILSMTQQKFASSAFEYGVNTDLEGYIFLKPLPYLLVDLGTDANNSPIYQSILLVGYGKAGVQDIPQLTSGKIEGQKIKIKGSLIYGEGKTLLQVTEADAAKIIVTDTNIATQQGQMDYGEISFTGEVIDPKCYFGVMKPGEGKPHRSCAIRCISGGIPPVFHTLENDYLVLMNEQFAPINQEILDLVGDRITLTGQVIQLGDLKIATVQTTAIKALSRAASAKKQLLAFEKGMTLCTTY